MIPGIYYFHISLATLFWCFTFDRAAKAKYELEQKEMARLQGFIDRFGAQASGKH